MGEKEPLDDKSYTHGVCPECSEKMRLKRLKRRAEKELEIAGN